MMAMAVELMNQYQAYARENNVEKADIASILAFLGSSDVQQQIKEDADELIGSGVTVNITPQQIQEILTQDVWMGYTEYAKKNSLPDLESIGTSLAEYIQSEDGQKRLEKGLMAMIDTSKVEEQLPEALETFVKDMTGKYADVISKAVEEKFTEVMTQAEDQISTAIQSAVNQVMGTVSSTMQGAMQSVMASVTSSMTAAMSQAMSQLGSGMENALSIDPEAFAKAIQMNMNEDDLSELMMSLMSYENASYEGNLKKLGYAQLDNPAGINIYPRDFECKSQIVNILDQYNEDMENAGQDEKVITYTDIVGTLMSSVTEIVNIISYVLVAFVAISLVVSSIMIGVITYISVLERKKEIGILRAIGASRHNVSQVFNAETFIIGFCAGAMGIGITLLLLVPANSLIRSLAGDVNVKAALPPAAAVVLIGLSVVLTLLGGLIPSRKAAKSDPVTALRTD